VCEENIFCAFTGFAFDRREGDFMSVARTGMSRRVFAGSMLAAATTPLVAGAQSPAKLRVGAVPVEAFAEAFYARDMGFFANAGLDVDIQQFTNGAGSATAIAGGALDIGISTVTMMANAAIHGVPLVYIAGGALFDGTPTTALIVGKAAKIAAAKDFAGTTVAVVGLKDGTHLPFVVWLTKNGVDPASVSVIELPFPSMVPAIARGTVAGAVCAEPFITAGADDARVFALIHNAIAPRFMTGGFFTTEPWFKANTALAKRFTAVVYQTARWANANRERSAEILQKYSKIDPTIIARMTRTDFSDTLTPQLIAPSLDAAYRAKFLDRPVSAAEMIAS
jgi:NitT/TauT family transport system substrate-binding protein